MQSRLASKGTESFESHELLEILLYSTCKRCDTNPVAHRLIKRFGSLTAVFGADAEQLMEVEGVGAASANMIVAVNANMKRILEESVRKGESLRESQKAKDYCTGLLKFEKTEQLRMIFLDNEYRFVSQEIISNGSIEQVKPDMLSIMKQIVDKRCSIVMITHNHPHGSEIASKEDKQLTRMLFNLLEKADIYLADHIIVGMHGSLSMRENELLPDIW